MPHHSHSVDDYLETIYFLAFPVGEYGPVVRDSPALAARVAEMLGVSRPSAGEMLKRLEADGLVERGERKEAILTEAGEREAKRVVRRHRLIERFLTDFMGYTPAESHVQADELGDTFTDDMIERIADRLGRPERCPHGWPVEPAVEHAENQHLVALSDVSAGERATIVRLAEHDGDLLEWFYEQNLVPGADVELDSVQEAAGQLTVRVDGGERTMSARAAAGLFVRPAAA
jgi:DtxR family transcriptional regulator, Mn-dependent transcriptional regulator